MAIGDPIPERTIGAIELVHLGMCADMRRLAVPLDGLPKVKAVDAHLRQLCAEYALSGLMGTILRSPGTIRDNGQQVPYGKSGQIWCAVAVRTTVSKEVDPSGVERLWLTLPRHRNLPLVSAVVLATCSKIKGRAPFYQRKRLVRFHGWVAPTELTAGLGGPWPDFFDVPQYGARVEDLHGMNRLMEYLKERSIGLLI